MFNRLIAGLAKTRSAIFEKISAIISTNYLDEAMLEQIEETLVLADINVATVAKIINGLKMENQTQRLEPALIRPALKKQMLQILRKPVVTAQTAATGAATKVIMIIGVNGTGKTTTVGKLAYRFKQEGKNVIIAACDTFRSAAIEQLEIWGRRAGVEIIRQQSSSDPAAVAFDAVQAALARKADIVLIDTAGRLHTKTNLVEELKKIRRVLSKFGAAVTVETLIVLDAGIGQNSLAQVKTFNEAVGIDGIILTKLDGTAKGGMVLTIQDLLAVPIKMIGYGEKIEDLKDFSAEEFVEALFNED